MSDPNNVLALVVQRIKARYMVMNRQLPLQQGDGSASEGVVLVLSLQGKIEASRDYFNVADIMLLFGNED
jgi:hypothetical protein